MRTEFVIQHGNLLFKENFIEINDTNKWTKRFNFVIPIFLIIYGLTSVLRYFKTGDQFLLWSGVFITSGIIVGLTIRLGKNYDRQLSYDSIGKVIIKKDILDRLKAVFIIKNSKKKRVVLLDFDRYSINDFELNLKYKNIKVEKE